LEVFDLLNVFITFCSLEFNLLDLVTEFLQIVVQTVQLGSVSIFSFKNLKNPCGILLNAKVVRLAWPSAYRDQLLMLAGLAFVRFPGLQPYAAPNLGERSIFCELREPW
jgi:hypothetical protein